MNIDWEPYLPALKLLAIAALVAFILWMAAHLLTYVLARMAKRLTILKELILQVKAPIHFLIPVLGLQTVWNSAPDDFLYIDGIRHLTLLIIIGGFTWLGLRVIETGQQMVIRHNPMNVDDNFNARRIQTQTRVLVQTLSFFVFLFGAAALLMTFPSARQFGTSMLASAGLAGLVVGFAAKPVLGNLLAGLQIAITQPIRLDDVVIVANEWGRIEEITGTYVVVRIWDDRRLVVPLQWFIENPFQNWTRKTSTLIGSVFFWVDYSLPLEPVRKELKRILQEVPELWDGRVSVLQVTDTTDKAIQLRILASSVDASTGWDLRCFIREKIINFISCNYPDSLPQLRANVIEMEDKPVAEKNQSEAEHQPPV